jgi:hydroxymethylpyrimidine/phosphomethylpyrimidine kinase
VTACLTIAGYDPTGSAGILADVETFRALGMQPHAVITAITAQNDQRVLSIEALSPRRIQEQLIALPEREKPAAVKIGMLATAVIVRKVAALLKRFRGVPLVLDPVLYASTGRTLLEPKAIPVLKKTLLPLATVITPNRAEAEKILGRKIHDLKRAAQDLLALGPRAVIITGGANADVLADSRGVKIIKDQRARGTKRGTGCRHSSALAACLAKGHTIRQAARQARQYVRRYVAST